jgi:O-antigen ligase
MLRLASHVCTGAAEISLRARSSRLPAIATLVIAVAAVFAATLPLEIRPWGPIVGVTTAGLIPMSLMDGFRLLALPLLVVAAGARFRPQLPRRAWLALGALGAAVIGSLVLGPPLAGGPPVRAGQLVMVAMLVGAIGVGLLLLLATQLGGRRAITHGLAIGAATTAAMGVVQAISARPEGYALLYPDSVLRLEGRAPGLTAHPNIQAALLAALVGLLLPAALAARGAERAWFAVVAAAAGLGVLLSGSRGGWVAMMAVFVAYGVAVAPRGRRAATGLIVAGLAAVAAMPPPVRSRLFSHAEFTTRPVVWHAAVVEFLRSPVVGVGYGGFALQLPELGIGGVPPHAHNIWLQWGAETGVLGLAAFAALAIVAVHGAWSARKKTDGNAWSLGLLLALLAVMVQGLVDDPMAVDSGYGALVFGCLLMASAEILGRPHTGSELSPLRRRLAARSLD